MSKLSHFNTSGDAHMVDVSDKPETHRVAIAEGRIRMEASTLEHIREGNHKKGDVLGIARVAGIMAAKKTAELVPLCHPLPLNNVEIEFETEDTPPAVYCRASASTYGRTGVEMEALMATQIALLTIYDMCKAVDRAMTIESVRLLEKNGGKSGHWKRDN